MSLIQEALKRQHEDLGGAGKAPAVVDKAPTLKLKPSDEDPGAAGDHGPVPGGAPDLAPPPLPHPPPAAPQGGSSTRVLAQLPQIPVTKAPAKRKPGVIIGLIVLVVLFLGVGAWYLMMFLGQAPAPVPPVKPPAVVTPTPTSTVPVAVVAPVPKLATQPVTPVTPVAPVTPPVAPVATQIVALVTPSNPPVGPVEPVKPGPVVWPPLKINMLMKTTTTAIVRINNVEYTVGDEIDGVQIVAIDSFRVTLRYKGETKLFKTGEITR